MQRLAVVSSVAVALVIGLGIGSVFFPTGITSTRPSRLYELQFTQEGVCSPKVWLAPWAVALNSQTVVRPPGATLPLSEQGFNAAPAFGNYSDIAFSVPNGTYNYVVFPQNSLRQSGNVTINGNDLVVRVQGPVIGCTITTTG